jgi:hypothetical protein
MFYPTFFPLTRSISVLPARILNELDIFQSQAVDGAAGGSYTPTADINIYNECGGYLSAAHVHEQMHFKGAGSPRTRWNYGTLPNADNQDIGISSGGQLLRFEAPGGNHDHDMDATGAVAGDWLVLQRANNANTITIRRDGSGYAGPNNIVQFAAAAFGTAYLYFDGTNWRLGLYHGGATAGADA